MYFYSLDDVSDGILNYCETVMDLRDETVEMTFYPFLWTGDAEICKRRL